jgi:hypothetical protein
MQFLDVNNCIYQERQSVLANTAVLYLMDRTNYPIVYEQTYKRFMYHLLQLFHYNLS